MTKKAGKPGKDPQNIPYYIYSISKGPVPSGWTRYKMLLLLPKGNIIASENEGILKKL